MKDWKGNDIKAGDTIVYVRIKPFFKNPKFHLVADGKVVQSIDLPEPPSHVWEPGDPMEVYQLGGKLMVKTTDGEFTLHTPLENPMRNIMKSNDHVLCIVGVSDSEEEFYQDYFKA